MRRSEKCVSLCKIVDMFDHTSEVCGVVWRISFVRRTGLGGNRMLEFTDARTRFE